MLFAGPVPDGIAGRGRLACCGWAAPEPLEIGRINLGRWMLRGSERRSASATNSAGSALPVQDHGQLGRDALLGALHCPRDGQGGFGDG